MSRSLGELIGLVVGVTAGLVLVDLGLAGGPVCLPGRYVSEVD